MKFVIDLFKNCVRARTYFLLPDHFKSLSYTPDIYSNGSTFNLIGSNFHSNGSIGSNLRSSGSNIWLNGSNLHCSAPNFCSNGWNLQSNGSNFCSNGSNLHLNTSNLVQIVRICIRMLRIPLEWIEFAFECFKSCTNTSNLHSNG